MSNTVMPKVQDTAATNQLHRFNRKDSPKPQPNQPATVKTLQTPDQRVTAASSGKTAAIANFVEPSTLQLGKAAGIGLSAAGAVGGGILGLARAGAPGASMLVRGGAIVGGLAIGLALGAFVGGKAFHAITGQEGPFLEINL